MLPVTMLEYCQLESRLIRRLGRLKIGDEEEMRMNHGNSLKQFQLSVVMTALHYYKISLCTRTVELTFSKP